MLPSDNKNSERESNLMLYLLYLYLFGPAFLVSFKAWNKEPSRVEKVFKSRDHLPNSKKINRLTTLFRVKGALSSYLELFIHTSFEQRLTFVT